MGSPYVYGPHVWAKKNGPYAYGQPICVWENMCMGRNIAMTTTNEVTQTGNTTTLLIRNFQPTDVGVYQCVFNDTFNGWILKRNINIL